METKAENVTSEGPILLSTTEVRGCYVMPELRAKLCELVKEGSLENEESTEVLIISGSHGNPDMGDSGLTNIDKLKDCNDREDGDITFGFYKSDCKAVGVKPDKYRPHLTSLPISEENIPDISKPMKKTNLHIFKDAFLSDESLCKITFKVIDIFHYHRNEGKLVKDIKKLNPKVLAITWCYSLNGDLAMALRQEGIFARMVMEHDLKLITGNPQAKFDEDQNLLIEALVKFEKKSGPRNLFLWGYTGTGKTLFLTEALKIKLSKIRKRKLEGKRVNVIVTVFDTVAQLRNDVSLLKDFREKYLKNIADESYTNINGEPLMKLSNLKDLLQEQIGDECVSDQDKLSNTRIQANWTKEQQREHLKKIVTSLKDKDHISKANKQREFDEKEFEQQVKLRINELICSISYKSPETYTILLIDEVPTVVEQDWSDLVVVDNVDWMLALSPGGRTGSGGGDYYEITPPANTTSTLSKKLFRRYRNCKEIREFHNWWLEHYKCGHIRLTEEILAEDSMLPQGSVPIWIEIPKSVDNKDALDIIASKYASGMSVTLAHFLPISIASDMKSMFSITKYMKNHGMPENLEECCRHLGWSYMALKDAVGTEDDCVILYLNPYHPILPEHLARARKLLIIVTTIWEPGSSLWPRLKSILRHESCDYICQMSNCKYVGQKLLSKMVFYHTWFCNECGSSKGLRFKCSQCDDFDLCESCKKANKHNHHEMIALENQLQVEENHVMSDEMIKWYDDKAKHNLLEMNNFLQGLGW